MNGERVIDQGARRPRSQRKRTPFEGFIQLNVGPKLPTLHKRYNSPCHVSAPILGQCKGEIIGIEAIVHGVK